MTQGHSLGGKVLLQLARSRAMVRELRAHDGEPGSAAPSHRLQLFVVDSFPGALVHTKRDTADGVDGVFEVLDFVLSVPPIIPSKKWLVDECRARGISMDVALWLSSNVSELPSQQARGPGDGLRWVFDPVGAAAMFESHNATNCWDVLLHGPPPGVDLHFIMASRSSRWHDTEARALLADALRAQKKFVADGGVVGDQPTRGNVFLYTVEAGHWIHTDNPTALTSIIEAALRY